MFKMMIPPYKMFRKERTITGNDLFTKEDYLKMARMYCERIANQLEYLNKAVNDLYSYCGMTWTEANKISVRFHEIDSILTIYREDIAKLMKSNIDNSNTV